jgi:pyruvate formate lyase activating enzyme
VNNIKGFLATSFVDWPGRVCSVFFVGGCNFRCPFCHNHSLVLTPDGLATIPFGAVLQQLARYKKWLGGVCISGGEPTLNPALPDTLATLKQAGWQVKLDTNGSQPRVLAQLLADGLVDMIAMDVKAPLVQEQYNRCAGVAVDLDQIRKSIGLIKESGVEHEFRMTVLPRFHSPADVTVWAATLNRSAFDRQSRLKLQNFNPRSTLDKTMAAEKSFPADIFAGLQERVWSEKNLPLIS